MGKPSEFPRLPDAGHYRDLQTTSTATASITADGDMICTNLTVGNMTELAGGHLTAYISGDKPAIDFGSDSDFTEVKLYTDSARSSLLRWPR